MTFPQPNSTQALLDAGSTFFRLKTTLQSPGDIFESEVGAAAIALGPDSDLAQVNVFYFDQADRYYPVAVMGGFTATLDPSKVSSFVLSPDRAFVGIIDPRPGIDYPLSPGRKARTLYAAGDLVNPNLKPPGFVALEDVFRHEPITIDILQYLTPPLSLTPSRSDKMWTYQYLPTNLAAGGSSSVIIPAYGRKSGFFTFKNLSGLNTITVHLYGVRVSSSTAPGPEGQYTLQLFTSAILDTQSVSYVFDSSSLAANQGGLWDLFIIELENYTGTPFPMTVRLSDDPL
jgi:hypothetical protein